MSKALSLYYMGKRFSSGGSGMPRIKLGASTDYLLLELWADPVATLTGGKVWLGVDSSGVSVAMSVPDATARAQSYDWPVTPSALSYSTPTSSATGLTIPTLAPGTKTLVVWRRTSSGTAVDPERNVLRHDGTWS